MSETDDEFTTIPIPPEAQEPITAFGFMYKGELLTGIAKEDPDFEKLKEALPLLNHPLAPQSFQELAWDKAVYDLFVSPDIEACRELAKTHNMAIVEDQTQPQGISKDEAFWRSYQERSKETLLAQLKASIDRKEIKFLQSSPKSVSPFWHAYITPPDTLKSMRVTVDGEEDPKKRKANLEAVKKLLDAPQEEWASMAHQIMRDLLSEEENEEDNNDTTEHTNQP